MEQNLVNENINDFLKPKTKEQILKDLKDKFKISNIKLIFDSGYNFNEFIKNFRRLKYYRTLHFGKDYKNLIYNRKDFTEKAIEEFIKAKDKLELYNPGSNIKLFNTLNKNNNFINLMYSFNKTKNIRILYNNLFDNVYMGEDYAFFSGNYLNLFIIPYTFIKKYFSI